MNAKRLSLFALSILSLVFVMGFTSAGVLTLTPVSIPSTADYNAGSVTGIFNLTYTGATNGNAVNFTYTSNFGNVTIPNTVIDSGQSVNVTATFSFSPTNVGSSMSGSVTAHISSADSNAAPFTISITSNDPKEVLDCAKTGNAGSLKVNSIDFTNNGLDASNTTFGEDNKWFPFENINAKVDVKDTGSEDVSNIEVDWGIWDTQKHQWIIAPSELKTIDLGNGKTKTMYQSFKIDNNMDVDLSDLTNGNHYQFYIIATGEVSNSTSTPTCISKAQNAEIEIESDFVVFTSLNFTGLDNANTAQCGQNVQVTGELWNIGDNDQNSVSVDVVGSDSALQLSQNIPVGDISQFDNKPFSFSFIVPNSINEKNYGLKFDVLDENGANFQESLNDQNSEFLLPLTVQGGCSLASQLTVAATVASGGQAGKPLQVNALITNTGNNAKSFNVAATGYSSWASSATLSQNTITLAPGQSANEVVTLNVNSDATGSQTFSLDLTSGSNTASQPVSVNIESAPGFLGITGNSIGGGSSWIWVIGLINLVLVVVIIVVAVRIARRR